MFKSDKIQIKRSKTGKPIIQAEEERDVYYALGYCNAKDRGLQMLMMRLLGQGRLSEFLDSSDESLKIDLFFRRMNWGKVNFQESDLKQEVLPLIQAYCKGINDAFSQSLPFELNLLGYKHEDWKIKDSVLLSRMMGYIGLAASQEEMEKLFIEMVQAGIKKERLQELFPDLLHEADFELIKKIKLEHRIVEPSSLWQKGLPRLMASNNWVVSGKRTESKFPILANDPHLEVNRLPNVWYEITAFWKDNFVAGAMVPGLPAIIIGRTKHLSWGVTYTFMDSVDSWIEKCSEGNYYREKEGYIPFKKREEIIKRKGKQANHVTFYENNHGVLSGNPDSKEESYLLSTRWSSAESGIHTINNIGNILHSKTVKEGQEVLRTVETAWNFVLADVAGNIGYQMSGLMPKRKKTWRGFIPLPGWQKENDWDGFVNPKQLPSIYNPKQGYFVTANNDLNMYGKIMPINLPMGSYRADRISEVLGSEKKCTIETMKKLQYDTFSVQAVKFFIVLQKILEEYKDTENAQILLRWNFQYEIESEAAYLFEEFYKELYILVFGNGGMGPETIAHIQGESGLFIDFYANFDKVLLSENSVWFEGKTREELYREAFEKIKDIKRIKWGEKNKLIFKNILLGGKLPLFLGFDKGPYNLPGGRASVFQGQIYRSAGRQTSFFPTIHFITDMAKPTIYTNIAGGVSDRRFSPHYANGIFNWLNGTYTIEELKI